MWFSPKLKKILLIGTIILLGCDVSMLFAQETQPQSPIPSANNNTPELQALQSEVKAQIKALQQNQGALPSDPPPVTSGNPATAISSNSTSMATPIPTTPQGSVPPPPSQPTNVSQGAVLPPAAFAGAVGSTNASGQGAIPAFDAASPQNLQAQSQAAAVVANVPPPSYQPEGENPVLNANNPQVPAPANNASENELNDAAFSSMVQNAMPMTPEQIQKLRSVYMASQFAASSVPGTPPRPTSSSVFVDLSPGAVPPIVRLSQGFVTTLVFVDSTGAPWPIKSYDLGNPQAFNIQWDKTSNSLMIQASSLYTYGNLVVTLKNPEDKEGKESIVSITLIPGQKAIDYRVDMHVPGYGPNARANVSSMPSSVGADLLNVLDGVPPPNSKALKVEGGDCQAWLSGNDMYVRTRLTLESPGYTQFSSSSDGMHAYKLEHPTPSLLVSQGGKVFTLNVEGF